MAYRPPSSPDDPKGYNPKNPDKVTPTNDQTDDRTLQPSKEQKEYNKEAYETQDWYPPSYSRSEKMSKENADYMKGTPFHRCGICTYYQAGHCKIVRGYISPDMGCKYYQEKYDPKRFGMITIKRVS